MDPSGGCSCPSNASSGHQNSSTHIEILRNEGDAGYRQELMHLRHTLQKRNERGWRKIALNFTPSWFSVVMGTGIVSILLHNLPYQSPWLRWISVAIFVLNLLLFLTFSTISIIRYMVYRGIFFAMLRHPVQSLFLGTFPMGMATLINMACFVCVPAWGPWTIDFVWAIWWINVVVSSGCCMFLPFAIMHVHSADTDKPRLQSMTAVWLLPVVSTIVASASGGIIAEVLTSSGRHSHSLWTLVTSYILLGGGLPLAMVILVMYFHRLTIHKLPPREVIVSAFLPLGPLGQGSFAIMQLGNVARNLFPNIPSIEQNLGSQVGQEFHTFGFIVALLMWGYGLVWLFFALASVSQSRFPFNMGWWGFTFPLGVYAISTTKIAEELSSTFFKVVGTTLSMCVVVLWALVAIKTAIASFRGTIFFAPCAKDFEIEWIDKKIQAHGRGKPKIGASNFTTKDAV